MDQGEQNGGDMAAPARPAGANRPLRRTATALAVVLARAVTAVVVWNVVRLVRGHTTLAQLTCIDPTDPCNFSIYRVTNNTSSPVVLRECSNYCGVGDQGVASITIPPGQTTPADVGFVTALVGSRQWWEVQVAEGNKLGCLVLDGHATKQVRAVVDVSSLGRCQ